MEEIEYTGVGLHHHYTLEQIEWICQFRGMKHSEIWTAFSIVGTQVSREVASLPLGLYATRRGLPWNEKRVAVCSGERGIFDEIGQVYGLKRGIDHASAKVRSRVRERPQ